MEKQKRVLHIIPGYGGGISSYVRNIVCSLSSKKVIVDVIGFSEYSLEFINEIECKGGKTYTLPSIRKDGIFRIISYYKRVLKLGEDYDMVHCHISGVKGLFFSILTRIYGIKRIAIHAHRTNNEDRRKFDFIKIKFDQICSRLFVSDFVSCSKKASEFIFGEKFIKNRLVMHMPNSIQTEKYCVDINDDIKRNIKRNLNIKEDELVIGHVGRFNLQKNHIFMIKIIERMIKRNIKFKWLFIGEGELFKSIRSMVLEKKLDKHVVFLGRREDVNILYSIFDVSILPSLFEGLPTVTVESQAAGIPSLVSDNITTEVDFGLGLVEYLSLNDKIDIWIDKIIENSKKDIPCNKDRIKLLEKKHFTSKSAAKLYEDFVYEKVLSYDLT